MGAIAAIPNQAAERGRSLQPVAQNSDGLAFAGNVAARNGKAKPTGAVQMPLLLMPGQNLSPEDLAIAEARYRSIEPLIRPGDFGAMWGQCRGPQDRHGGSNRAAERCKATHRL